MTSSGALRPRTQSPTAEGIVERITAVSRRPADPGAAPTGAVSLAMGEPGNPTPHRVAEAAVAAIRAGRTRYAPLSGEPSLRRELARWVSERSGADIDVAEVTLAHGASAALAATILAVVQPGQQVLVPEPTYSLYADHIALAGGRCRWVPPGRRSALDLDALWEQAPLASALVLCNPSNPTGQVLGDDEMDALERLVHQHPGLTLIVDEAYSDILFDGRRFRSALTLARDRVIVVGTFSKSFAMTGWRLGYAIGAAETMARIDLIHRTINGALNTFVQDAALEALQTPDAALAAVAREYQRRRDMVVSALAELDGVSVGVPAGAFYAFPRIHSRLTSDELVRRFADGGVVVRSGAEYGPSGEGHVRLSFATDEASLAVGLQRFADVVTRIQEEENRKEDR